MDELYEYENDLDFNVLLKKGITKDNLLDFMFKKGGKINVSSMTYFAISAGYINNNLTQSISELVSDKLVKCKNNEYEYYEVTLKAKWIRLYSKPMWNFWASVATILAMLLAIIALCRS